MMYGKHKKADFYAKTVELQPLPPKSAMELLMFHVENAARYASECGPEVSDAISRILRRPA